MCSLLLVEAVKIRNMLHVVCIKFSGFHNKVGLYIIFELYDVEFISVVFKYLCCLCKYLGMRNG